MINLYEKNDFVQSPSSNNPRELYSSVIIWLIWTFWHRRFVFFLNEFAECNFDTRVFHLPEFRSLFDKKVFEHAAERFIFGYGNSFSSTGLCRLNWRLEQHNGVEWIAFENDGRYSSKGLFNPCKSVIQTFYLTPISEDHLLCVCFTQVTRSGVKGLTDAFKKLRHTVMESTELSLSEE